MHSQNFTAPVGELGSQIAVNRVNIKYSHECKFQSMQYMQTNPHISHRGSVTSGQNHYKWVEEFHFCNHEGYATKRQQTFPHLLDLHCAICRSIMLEVCSCVFWSSHRTSLTCWQQKKMSCQTRRYPSSNHSWIILNLSESAFGPLRYFGSWCVSK